MAAGYLGSISVLNILLCFTILKFHQKFLMDADVFYFITIHQIILKKKSFLIFTRHFIHSGKNTWQHQLVQLMHRAYAECICIGEPLSSKSDSCTEWVNIDRQTLFFNILNIKHSLLSWRFEIIDDYENITDNAKIILELNSVSHED